MTRRFGAQSMVDPLRRVLVRAPDEALGNADPGRWHYAAKPDLEVARKEHHAMVEILEREGVEVIHHRTPLPDHADAIYVHDPALILDRGAIILRMGKQLRNGEEEAMAATLGELGVPILATLHGEARAEGGDLMWLDPSTLAAGRGFRTNSEGIRQLRDVLADSSIDVLAFDLPCFQGPDACLHLMSGISMVDHDLAVVAPSLLPAPLWQLLMQRGFRAVEVPDDELPSMGANVLALAPSRCLMLEGNPVTQRRLEAAGCEVLTFRGDEIALNAEGGPTCLTRPILRG
jgi:N-dimethylarginine dimethylaminohydrolase